MTGVPRRRGGRLYGLIRIKVKCVLGTGHCISVGTLRVKWFRSRVHHPSIASRMRARLPWLSSRVCRCKSRITSPDTCTTPFHHVSLRGFIALHRDIVSLVVFAVNSSCLEASFILQRDLTKARLGFPTLWPYAHMSCGINGRTIAQLGKSGGWHEQAK